jgi:hypothetical protein
MVPDQGGGPVEDMEAAALLIVHHQLITDRTCQHSSLSCARWCHHVLLTQTAESCVLVPFVTSATIADAPAWCILLSELLYFRAIPLGVDLVAPHAESKKGTLTIRLEAFYHHLPLRLVIPEVSEGLFLLGIIRR